jgi:hypothetical protein
VSLIIGRFRQTELYFSTGAVPTGAHGFRRSGNVRNGI